MRFAKSLILFLMLGSMTFGSPLEPERSVIQIFTYLQVPYPDAPWRFEPVRQIGGSGFVIKGKRIMTNAHVVSWAKQIIVRRYQDPHPYEAEVEFIGHECDLAVLKVKEEKFFENLEPLEFGTLPKTRSAVVTYGYPAGGEEISYTRGVVSRIELQTYSHIWIRQFLSVQTDAAINPGNSGGPVIQDDRVAGVAFQGTPGLQNVGFFIPTPVIDHFLKDIADQKYDGFPEAGLRVVPLQNLAYRKYLKLPEHDLGARVDSLLPISTTREVLKPDDVILQIGPFPLASDGTILYEGNRVSAALACQFAQAGEQVPMKIWRDGQEKEVSLPLKIYDADRPRGYQYDTPPRYFVYGGLVFIPLTYSYLQRLGGTAGDADKRDLYYELYYRRDESPSTWRREPIVLASVLADDVNANFGVRGRVIVDKINGVRIEKLEDGVRALESNTNHQDVIEFLPNRSFECLDHAEVAKARNRILQTYAVPNDRRL